MLLEERTPQQILNDILDMHPLEITEQTRIANKINTLWGEM